MRNWHVPNTFESTEVRVNKVCKYRSFRPNLGATIADGASALERFKEKAIIAYCNDGMTAGAAARHLGRLGFKQAYNLRGGLVAWRGDNLPLIKE